MKRSRLFLSLLMVGGLILLACAPQQKQAETPEKVTSQAQGVFQTLTVAQSDPVLKTPGLVILDLRTPSEFQGGHLKQAQMLDFYASDFQSRLRALDKKSPYLIYCQSGVRSAKTLAMMQEAGFEKVYELAGGYRSWADAGQPVEQ
ncbi:MAG: rhodanese-like domain-containing protein [Candidatus Sericytochromatia bacterium]|nr:rhodanese-like domain-containing protein [Candidatus Sericytochromatia bacterium]